MAEQQNRLPHQHGDKLEFSMQCHIHMHKNLHSAMYRMWQKKNPAQETGVEKQFRNQNRTQPSSRHVAP